MKITYSHFQGRENHYIKEAEKTHLKEKTKKHHMPLLLTAPANIFFPLHLVLMTLSPYAGSQMNFWEICKVLLITMRS